MHILQPCTRIIYHPICWVPICSRNIFKGLNLCRAQLAAKKLAGPNLPAKNGRARFALNPLECTIEWYQRVPLESDTRE